MTVDLDALEQRAANMRGNSREIIEMLLEYSRELEAQLQEKPGGLAEELLRRSGRPDLVKHLDMPP